MKMLGLALLGLIGGFVAGELLAVIIGVTTGQLSGSAPPGPVLWIARSLPFVVAVVGAVTLPLLAGRSGSKAR